MGACFALPATATVGAIALTAGVSGAVGAAAGNAVQIGSEIGLQSKAEGAQDAQNKGGREWLIDVAAGGAGGAVGGVLWPGASQNMARPIGTAAFGETVALSTPGLVGKRGLEKVCTDVTAAVAGKAGGAIAGETYQAFS